MKAVAAHDTLLFNLKDDPGEKNNLYKINTPKALQLFIEMKESYKNLGELPPHLLVRKDEDNSHYEYLKNKNKSK